MDKIKHWFKPLLPYLVCGLLGVVPAIASPIKNWTTNEYITYTDLNANFNHLHASAGHGHGPIITAADISSSAGIRPEQTTFGNATNRNLVAVGTWKVNPDAGITYVPVNMSGSLTLTLTKMSGTDAGYQGVLISGAAMSGSNPDAGTQVFTVVANNVNFNLGETTSCYNYGFFTSLASPVQNAITCYSVPSPTFLLAPSGVVVEVYNNKVQ